MIYDRIDNIEEIVGKNAASLSWPLGAHGIERRDFFLKKPFVATHFHCQPYKEDDPGFPRMGEVCSGFLINTANRPKDEVETAALYSFELPEYYGRNIDEIVSIDELGENAVTNRSRGRKFVILLEQDGKLKAVVPKKIGEIIPYQGDGINENMVAFQGNSVSEAIKRSPYSDSLKGKVVGLWYTNSKLRKTPVVNIEDSWDTAMLARYDKEITDVMSERGDEFFMGSLDKKDKPLVTSVIKDKLVATSRKFADAAEGNFLAAYNLHDHLALEKGKVRAHGLQSDIPPLFGGPQKFLDSFLGLVKGQFKEVELVWEEGLPIVLASDKSIVLSNL